MNTPCESKPLQVERYMCGAFGLQPPLQHSKVDTGTKTTQTRALTLGPENNADPQPCRGPSAHKTSSLALTSPLTLTQP